MPKQMRLAVTMLAPAGAEKTKLAIIPIKKQRTEKRAEQITTGR